MRGRLGRCGAVWLLAMLAAWTPGAALAAEGIGYVLRLDGAVVAQRGADSVRLQVGSQVLRGDSIKTQSASRVHIALDDGSILAIGEESEVVVQDYRRNADGSGMSGVVQLLLGIVRATLAAGPDKHFEIRTRTVVASVRSTDWLVEAAGDRVSVLSIAGTVAVAPPTGGWRVELERGLGVDVSGGGGPPEAKRWGAARIADVLSRTSMQ